MEQSEVPILYIVILSHTSQLVHGPRVLEKNLTGYVFFFFWSPLDTIAPSHHVTTPPGNMTLVPRTPSEREIPRPFV
jgi:hypothetical protein